MKSEIKNIDVWNHRLGWQEYVRLAGEAKDSDVLRRIILEAKSVLGRLDYNLFRKGIEDITKRIL